MKESELKMQDTDTLRPEYDISTLTVAALGSSWGKKCIKRNPWEPAELPVRVTRQWLEDLSVEQLNALLRVVNDEYQSSNMPANRRTCQESASKISDELEARRSRREASSAE